MKIRKAILTGGGRATRLHPITTTINKHLLPLANKPMIFHAIETVAAAGITDIFINLNPGEAELQKHVGDGGHWGIRITYFEQTGGPQGIAHVVNEAKTFIGNDPFLFYLSDNILLGSVQDMVETFSSGDYDCMLALSKVPDPQRFGVPYFDTSGVLVDVVEKPLNPPNDFAVTGMYLYGPRVFFDAFDNIEKSDRGEYEISSIHSHFLKTGKRVGYKEVTGWWKDTGKPEDLLNANKLLLDQISEPSQALHRDAWSGVVHIGAGSQVGEDVIINGPVMIGQNCVLHDCVIGPHVTIGSGAQIRGARISNTIILDHATIDTDTAIRDSLIGKHVTLKKHASENPTHRMIVGDKTIIEL